MSADAVSRLNAALEGRYRIERLLGEGGTSTVYLADDLKHERQVALKVLKPELAAAVGAERFLAEIKTTANLQHPAILPLHDSGVADDVFYYVMPFVRGATLRDRIATEGPLSLADVVLITSDIANALAYAHAEGVIHRDVKPANILLSEGHAVLADFGLSKALLPGGPDGLTQTAGVGGTVRYMSPEQMRGDPGLDGRSDQYSLACVVYEMLSGEPPFTGRTAWAVIARQMSGEMRSLGSTRSGIPPAADAVISRALEAQPADRFPGVADFAGALASVLSTEPRSRGHEGAARGRVGWPARAGFLALAGAALWVLGTALWGPSDPRAELDPDRVVVFPLVDQRSGAADQAAGEQLAIMVGTTLEHAEPLRWVDGWDWLEPSLRSDMGSWSIEQGIAIALGRGARYVVDGRILGQADSVQVMVRLHDAASGELVLTNVQSGGLEELPALGRRAVVALLPSLIDPGRSVQAGALDAYSPEAVADWLNGEREYRESRFASALVSFRSAVAADSTMAIAAMRGAQSARWLLENGQAISLIEAALANEASLSPRQRLLAQGIRRYFRGDALEAERVLLEAISRDPAWSDAWMALGEVYYHLMPGVGSGAADAEEAFRAALDHDPGFTPPRVHLAELALRRGDVVRGDSLRLALPSGEAQSTHLDLMSRCVRSGREALDWSEVAGSEEGGFAVLSAAVSLGAGGAHPRCAIDAFGGLASWGARVEGGGPRTADMAWSTLLGLQSLNAATGNHDEVRRLITSARQFEQQQDYLWVVSALTGSPWGEEARRAAERLERADQQSATALWAIGVWNALRGSPEVVAEVAEIARVRARSATDGSVAVVADSLRSYGVLADVLEGWSALARADTSAAVERFTEVRPVGSPAGLEWSLWEPLAAERLQLARLRLATGELEAAIEAAESLDHPQPVVYVAYVAESLRVRVRAAEEQGDAERARQYRARLDRLVGGMD
jgi:serine/threonine-protein kinase